MTSPVEQVTLTFLFKRNDETTFDQDYYINKHIPLAKDLFESMGLISWFVTEKTSGIPGLESPFAAQSTMVWKARGEDGLANIKDMVAHPKNKEVQADIANFTNGAPVAVLGVVRARGDVK